MTLGENNLPRLIGKIFLFIIIGLLVLSPICILSKQSYLQSLKAPVFRFNKEVTILIAGDSHTQSAINPDYISHSVNIAESAENYFYTYYKLRHFLDNNPQVTTVILAFSWHNFSADYQESFMFSDISSTIDLYFPLLDQAGRDVIKSWNSSYLVPWARHTLGMPLQVYRERLLQRKILGLPLNRENFDFFGGYRSSKTSNVSQENISKKLKRYYNVTSSSGSNSSTYMTDYFGKILELCAKRHIKVVLFNSPVHKMYRDGVPKSSVTYFNALKSKLLLQYENVEYVDCSDFTLPTDHFYDGDHVNSKGTKVVTEYLVLKLGLLH